MRIAKVEQAALIGIRFLCFGMAVAAHDAGQQAGAVGFQRIKSAALDQRIDHPLVDRLAVDALAEVEKALERPARRALRHQRFDRALAGALDGTQAVIDTLQALRAAGRALAAVLGFHRLETVHAQVDVRRLELDAKQLGVIQQDLELVGVVRLNRHIGGEELGREVGFEPSRVVRQQRIGSRVRFVETVARELLHQVEDLVGLFGSNALLGRTLAEDASMLSHLLGLLLAHRTAQHVRPAQAVAAQYLGRLHDLLLVDEDAIGFFQHLTQQRVRVLDCFLAMLARDEGGNQVHRAGAVKRHQRDQILEARGLGVLQQALHAGRLELEHALRVAVAEQLENLAIVQLHALPTEALLLGVAGHDEILGQLQDRQGREAQEVELDQANRFDVVLVKLADRAGRAGLLVLRAKVGDLAGCDQHAAGMHADIAHHALDAGGQLQQLGHFFLVLFALLQLGRFQAGVDHLRVRLGRHHRQRHRLARRGRNQLGNAVHLAITHAQHAADVAQRRLGRHRAEGGNLADRVTAVFILDVINHPVAVALAEVDVEVGHRDPFRVQEALEQQVVFQRVQVGDLQHIGDQRAGARAPARADRAAIVLGPPNKVRHDQEVTGETHVHNGFQLEFQPLDVTRQLLGALRLVRVEQHHPLAQPLMRGMTEVLIRRHLHAVHQRRGEVRQLRLAQHQAQAAAARNLHRVGDGRRNVGKQRLHLGLAAEKLPRQKAFDALRVGQRFALGHADPGLMRLEVLDGLELHRMSGHHR